MVVGIQTVYKICIGPKSTIFTYPVCLGYKYQVSIFRGPMKSQPSLGGQRPDSLVLLLIYRNEASDIVIGAPIPAQGLAQCPPEW